MGDTGDLPRHDAPLPGAFARIEASVDAGDTDLSRLGFWRILRQVKTDPALALHRAETVGRIDRKVFESRVRPRFPVWFGNLVLLLGLFVGGLAIVVAMNVDDPTVAGIALLVAAGVWSVSVHCLAHWVVGAR